MNSGFVTRAPNSSRLGQIIAFNETHGGRTPGSRCSPQSIKFPMPGGSTSMQHSSGCGAPLMDVEYRDPAGEVNHARVCVVDDAMHHWPRFSPRAGGRVLEMD